MRAKVDRFSRACQLRELDVLAQRLKRLVEPAGFRAGIRRPSSRQRSLPASSPGSSSRAPSHASPYRGGRAVHTHSPDEPRRRAGLILGAPLVVRRRSSGLAAGAASSVRSRKPPPPLLTRTAHRAATCRI